MATTQIVKVRIQELSKYGFKANDKYVGLSKQLSEADKARLVPGAEFDAEFYIADSGKEYLNKILSSAVPTSAAKAVAAPVVDTERSKKFTPKFKKGEAKAESTTMSKSEWQAKDRSQLIGGLSHDAAAITASLVNTTSLDVATSLEVYKSLLEGMLRIRDEVK